jgi:SAM-dependent methyltransferase
MNNPAAEVTEGNPECILCGREGDVGMRFVKNGHPIYRCLTCGLMFVFPQPSSEELVQLYDSDYYRRGDKYLIGDEAKTESLTCDEDAQKLKVVKTYKSAGRLLDVGCAMGGFLSLARREGFDVQGVEVSEFCAQYVKKHHDIDVHNGDLLSAQFHANMFDVVTMWDVLEHLGDPQGAVSEAYRIIRPGGFLCVSTGDSGSVCARIMAKLWHLLTPPQHLFYFTKKSLQKCLVRSSFKVKNLSCPGKQSKLGFILFKAREAFGPLVAPLQFLTRALNLDSFAVHVNLYDIVTCVAQKADSN